ncbi:16S rRNA (guanine(966)-N(2))-methyltransferase RsmD [soil metagenome]
MRILGGTLKGRSLSVVVLPGTRPTTDAMRESLFSTLESHIDWTECTVLDLFSGTGALGFEALSRGASHCTFVEKSTSMCRSIERNAKALELTAQCTVHVEDVMSMLKRRTGVYDVVFCDPPYDLRSCNQVLRALDSHRIVSDGGVFVAEHDEREVVVDVKGWQRKASRQRGSTVVDVLQFTDVP